MEGNNGAIGHKKGVGERMRGDDERDKNDFEFHQKSKQIREREEVEEKRVRKFSKFG
jgi:hypothetical protein